MRAFDTIQLGKIEWCIWGRDDKIVYLCSAKSVFSRSMLNKDNDLQFVATYEGSDIERDLNKKFIHKLCKAGIPYESIIRPVGIFSATEYGNITRLGFALPPVKEGAFWLKSNISSDGEVRVQNYMVTVDNNGDLNRECIAFDVGVRAVVGIKREYLTKEQNELIEYAAVAYDKTKSNNTGAMSSRKLSDLYIWRRPGKDGISTVYKISYNLILCTLNENVETDLFNEIKDTPVNRVCSLKHCAVDSISLAKEYALISVKASPDVSVSEIVKNIRRNLTPKSLFEDMKFKDKIMRKVPKYWSADYFVETGDISMQTVESYLSSKKDYKED